MAVYAGDRPVLIAHVSSGEVLDDGVEPTTFCEVVTLDTRNAFEVDAGTFDNAIDWRIDKFTEFPPALRAHKSELQDKTVVSFCTGGIRCEKAAIHMQNIGYNNVYQLEGGILKYFEDVGGAHYTGDCFVFDYRTALNPQLEAVETTQCFACRAVDDGRDRGRRADVDLARGAVVHHGVQRLAGLPQHLVADAQ
eukprot:gene21361-41389_t